MQPSFKLLISACHYGPVLFLSSNLNTIFVKSQFSFSNNKISTYSAFVATKEKFTPFGVRELPKGNGFPLFI